MKTLIDPAKKYQPDVMFVIRDWAGNIMDYGTFKTWVDAEVYIQQRLGDDYETDRQEYEIVEV